ncbi:MAG TPA: ABC transporter substrate-binding protein [Verrucomicrobiae bacterium]|nr:ABC transporter substrate-binding protein [Verrucomicrobiae bacterium]
MRPLLALLLLALAVSHSARAAEIRFVTWRETQGFMEHLIRDFEAENPDLKIVRDIGPHSSTEFHDLVAQKFKNHDREMDVFFMDVIWPAEFASAGWALPLDRFFPAAEQKEFLPAAIRANRYSGAIYGVPLFVDAGLLYYRSDLLRRYGLKPPRTWPELVEQAKTIIAGEKTPGLVGFSGQFKQYEGLVCNMMEYILSNNGALWDEARLAGSLSSGAAEEAVRFVRDRIVGEISQRGVLAYQEPESLALFTEGRAVFHRNWPYAWEEANDAQKSKVAGKVGMTPLPAFLGGKSAGALGGWQLGISRFSRRPELAWRFIAFMTREETQKRIALWTGRGVAREKIYRDAEVLAKYPQFRTQFEISTAAVPRPPTPVYVPLSNIMQRYFSAAVSARDSDIDRLARHADRDMDRVLDLLRGRAAR